MKYNPKDASQCFPPGDYQATLDTAVEGESKSSGKEMVTLRWKVYAGNRTFYVEDYIVNPDGIWKFKQIAKALGEEKVFNAGEFVCEDYIGRNVTVTIKIEPGQGDFADKNRVKAYKPKPLGVSASGAPPMHEAEAAADIPF